MQRSSDTRWASTTGLTVSKFLRSFEYVPSCSTNAWYSIAWSEPPVVWYFQSGSQEVITQIQKDFTQSINSMQYLIVTKNCPTIWRVSSSMISVTGRWSTSKLSPHNGSSDALIRRKWCTRPSKEYRRKLDHQFSHFWGHHKSFSSWNCDSYLNRDLCLGWYDISCSHFN